MTETTFEQVWAEIRQLPLADQQRLRLLLTNELGQQENGRTLAQIAQEQGVRPRSFAELLGPDLDEEGNDDVDEFLQDLYAWRRGQPARSVD